MLMIAAMSLSLFSHKPHAPHLPNLLPRHHAEARMTVRHAHVGPWRIAARSDPFGGSVACSVTAHRIMLERAVLVIRLADRGPTTKAIFRLDSGPPQPISETFDAVEARGFFPQRGWIVDPDGGEAALPVVTVVGAKVLTLRINPARHPISFDVSHLPEALTAAKGLGCPL
jgi:hypothetical protein